MDADGLNVFDGLGKGGDAHIVGGAGFKFEGQCGVGGAFKTHIANHFATALIGGELIELPFFAIEHSHTGGSIHFVCGEGVEIAV